jgi:hypothetical protein
VGLSGAGVRRCWRHGVVWLRARVKWSREKRARHIMDLSVQSVCCDSFLLSSFFFSWVQAWVAGW